jgi:hypothetical protein
MKFQVTHKVFWGICSAAVMVRPDGAAYTAREWIDGAPASLARTDDGDWTLRGERIECFARKVAR